MLCILKNPPAMRPGEQIKGVDQKCTTYASQCIAPDPKGQPISSLLGQASQIYTSLFGATPHQGLPI